jgi:diguanylate cyclase (GGDEF)-like protein
MENVQVSSELEERVRDRTAALEKANEEIRQLSVTDELTGLNNRRGFYLLAEQALREARRHGRSCLIAFLDVDGLKRVNDEQGHDVGDSLIADVAQVLRATLRESDILARMGGDEFCVLATEPTGDPALLRNRLLEAFRCFNEAEHRPYRLSDSIGLVQAAATASVTVDELIARADELMYEEKRRPGSVRGSRTDPVRSDGPPGPG